MSRSLLVSDREFSGIGSELIKKDSFLLDAAGVEFVRRHGGGGYAYEDTLGYEKAVQNLKTKLASDPEPRKYKLLVAATGIVNNPVWQNNEISGPELLQVIYRIDPDLLAQAYLDYKDHQRFENLMIDLEAGCLHNAGHFKTKAPGEKNRRSARNRLGGN